MRFFHKLVRDRCYSNIFAEKFGKNIGVFFAQTTASFCKNEIITLVFEKNANFFAENWQNRQKIAIITSTPGHHVHDDENVTFHKNDCSNKRL
jgi:hypothetical protein